jgi:hypothetical protein
MGEDIGARRGRARVGAGGCGRRGTVGRVGLCRAAGRGARGRRWAPRGMRNGIRCRRMIRRKVAHAPRDDWRRLPRRSPRAAVIGGALFGAARPPRIGARVWRASARGPAAAENVAAPDLRFLRHRCRLRRDVVRAGRGGRRAPRRNRRAVLRLAHAAPLPCLWRTGCACISAGVWRATSAPPSCCPGHGGGDDARDEPAPHTMPVLLRPSAPRADTQVEANFIAAF